MKKVFELMKKRVFSVDVSETIQKAISKMDKYGFDELPVTRAGKLAGMVSYRELVEIAEPAPTKVKNVMFSPPRLKPEESQQKALKLMIESGVSSIPVVKNFRLVGIISDYDILKEMKKEFSGFSVRDFLRPDVPVLTFSDSIQKARRLMDFHKVDRLIVVGGDGKIAGVVLLKDILKNCVARIKTKQGSKDFAGSFSKYMSESVSNIYRREIRPVDVDSKANALVSQMLSQNLTGVHVSNRRGEPLGIVLRKDLVFRLRERLERRGVVVNFSGLELDTDVLVQVKRIVSDHVRKILYLTKKIERVEVHIKPFHDIETEKYVIRLHVKRPGKDFHIKEEGFDLLFTMERALSKLEEVVRREYL